MRDREAHWQSIDRPSIDRRSFLVLSGACAAMLLSGALRHPAISGATPTSTIVIADRRFPDSIAFAEGMARCGATLVERGSDLARLWYDAIEPQLATGGALRLAGLTLDGDRFALQQLASGVTYEACYRGVHDRRGGVALHRLRGPEIAGIAAAFACSDWAGQLGSKLARLKPIQAPLYEQRIIGWSSPAANDYPYAVSWLSRLSA